MADLPKEGQDRSSVGTAEELVAAARHQLQLNSVPLVHEQFLLEIVQSMLSRTLNRDDLPEDMKLQARLHASLIEDQVRTTGNAPNRGVILIRNAIWAGMSLGMTSGPGLAEEDIERFRAPAEMLLAQARLDMARAGGKKSGAVRKEIRLWMPHARELALAAHSADPSASNDKLAGETVFSWRLHEPKCPSLRTLSRFVAELRDGGALPPRTGSRRK